MFFQITKVNDLFHPEENIYREWPLIAVRLFLSQKFFSPPIFWHESALPTIFIHPKPTLSIYVRCNRGWTTNVLVKDTVFLKVFHHRWLHQLHRDIFIASFSSANFLATRSFRQLEAFKNSTRSFFSVLISCASLKSMRTKDLHHPNTPWMLAKSVYVHLSTETDHKPWKLTLAYY